MPDEPINDELETLRKTNGELTAKLHKLREKITALEGENVTLKATAEEAEARRHDAVVGKPLRDLANAISPVPDIFLSEFLKEYKVEPDKDGKLQILRLEDGKPARDKNGNAVDFTHNGIFRLTAADAYTNPKADARTRVFKVLVNYAGASGGGAPAAGVRLSTKQITRKPLDGLGIR